MLKDPHLNAEFELEKKPFWPLGLWISTLCHCKRSEQIHQAVSS